MNNPARKRAHTIIVAIAFLLIYTFVMFFAQQKNYEKLIVMHNRSQAESVCAVLDQYERKEIKVGEAFTDDLNAETSLKALELAAGITNGKYTGPRMWADAMAVRVTNGSLDLPREAAGMFPGLTADDVLNEYVQTRLVQEQGEGAPMEVLLTSGKAADDWYIVSWKPAKEYDDFVKANTDKEAVLKGLSDYYSGEIFLVSAEDSADGEKGTILYGTTGANELRTISEFGVSEEDLRKEYFDLETAGGNQYICIPVALESGRVLVLCDSVTEEKKAFLGDVLTQVLFAGILFMVLITWCSSTATMMSTAKLKEEHVGNYSPEAVKKRTVKLGALSVMLMFIVAFLTVVMQYMYQEDKVGSAVLSLLEKQIEDEAEAAPKISKRDAKRYESFGREISELLTAHPDWLSKERLGELARIISADYLIVFDENGDEIGCSEDYKGFSLGTAEKEPSTDFRRLLKGISSIIHEPEQDFITGEERQIVGIRYDIPDKKGQYGAILIPVSPGKGNGVDLNGKQRTYHSMTGTGEMILEIDPASQIVVSGSREEYVGSEAAGLGIKKESLQDRQMNFFRADRQWYFGVSRLIDGKIYYYMADNTTILLIGVLFALLTSIVFLTGYTLTSLFALRDYTKENYEKYVALILEARQKNKERLDEKTPYMSQYVRRWDEMLPEKKAGRVMQIGMGLFMAILLIVAVSNTSLSGHSVMNFVIEGNWTKGVNLFGIVAVIMVFSIEYLVYLIVKVVFLLLYGVLDARGETVGRLIRSLINYILIASAVFLSLNFLGVDTSTLLASLGLLSLAISLGAKDIVADILSGISIVFEGTYRVGDTVEISGFKGRVVEIGIRSTKLLGGANEIKTINNSSIGNVMNLSKRTSFCTVSFTLKASEPLAEIEAMLARELPAYRDKIPGIISGPAYAGVASVADGKMKLEIIAEAKEEDLFRVERGMNRMLQSLYERGLLKSIVGVTNVSLAYAEGDRGIMRTRDLSESPQDEH